MLPCIPWADACWPMIENTASRTRIPRTLAKSSDISDSMLPTERSCPPRLVRTLWRQFPRCRREWLKALLRSILTTSYAEPLRRRLGNVLRRDRNCELSAERVEERMNNGDRRGDRAGLANSLGAFGAKAVARLQNHHLRIDGHVQHAGKQIVVNGRVLHRAVFHEHLLHDRLA